VNSYQARRDRNTSTSYASNTRKRGYTRNIFRYTLHFWLNRFFVKTFFNRLFYPLFLSTDFFFPSNYVYLLDQWKPAIRFYYRYVNCYSDAQKDVITYYIQLLPIWRRKISPRYQFQRHLSAWKRSTTVYWSTRSNKTVISLLSSKKYRTLLHIYSGLFIKFFNYNKSLKKSRLVTISLLRYVRALLFLSPIRRLSFFFKGLPFFGEQLLQVFGRPVHDVIIAAWALPKDTLKRLKRKKFVYTRFYLHHTHAYCFQKIRACGRIKRKIRRRLLAQNKIVDS
jgi:hypothetical protein